MQGLVVAERPSSFIKYSAVDSTFNFQVSSQVPYLTLLTSYYLPHDLPLLSTHHTPHKYKRQKVRWLLIQEGRWFSFLLVFLGFLGFSFCFLFVFFLFSFCFLFVFLEFQTQENLKKTIRKTKVVESGFWGQEYPRNKQSREKNRGNKAGIWGVWRWRFAL